MGFSCLGFAASAGGTPFYSPSERGRESADAFNRALWCLSFVSGISLSADLSVSGFAGGLGLVLSLSRSPRLGPSGLIGLPKEAAVLATVLLRSYVLFSFVCSASLGRPRALPLSRPTGEGA